MKSVSDLIIFMPEYESVRMESVSDLIIFLAEYESMRMEYVSDLIIFLAECESVRTDLIIFLAEYDKATIRLRHQGLRLLDLTIWTARSFANHTDDGRKMPSKIEKILSRSITTRKIAITRSLRTFSCVTAERFLNRAARLQLILGAR